MTTLLTALWAARNIEGGLFLALDVYFVKVNNKDSRSKKAIGYGNVYAPGQGRL